jgi:putative ABC transport system permease protein
MTIQDQFRTALSNVGRRKLRSVLASLGVVVGTLTIVIMVSLASGVREQINRQFESVGLDRLMVTASGGGRGGFGPRGFGAFGGGRRRQITSQDVSEWKKLSGVRQVVPEVNLPASVALELKWNGTNVPVRIGGEEFRPGAIFQELPQPVTGSLDLPEAGGIVISRGAAQAVGLTSNKFAQFIGQPVETVLRTPRGETQSYSLRLCGISDERAPTIQVSLADRIAMKGWWFNTNNVIEREGYDSVTIRAKDVSRANDLSAQLRRDGFQVQSLEMFMTIANRIVTAITVMFTLVGSIALLVATIGITNTMVMAIYERTREIGILKAMGASNREIRQMFMLEAGFIGLAGGVIGLGLGWLLGLGLNRGIQAYLKYREIPMHGDFFVVTLALAVGVVAFAAFIGLIGGLLPAQRAAQLDPLEALRHE